MKLFSQNNALPELHLQHICAHATTWSTGSETNHTTFSFSSSRSSSQSPGHTRSHPAPNPILHSTLSEPIAESVLAIVTDGKSVFAGTQGVDILVWSLEKLELVKLLKGHESSVLCLELAQERKWLFSGSGDNTIRIWHTRTLECLYRVEPPHYNIGDILSLAYVAPSHLTNIAPSSPSNNNFDSVARLYFGTQDCSIMWLDLPASTSVGTPDGESPRVTPSASSASLSQLQQPHKFFDSLSSGERMRASMLVRTRSNSSHHSPPAPMQTDVEDVPLLEILGDNVVSYAHHGYVYCLSTTILGDRKIVLVSAGGDADIKLWTLTRSETNHLITLSGSVDAVLSLVIHESTLYAGHQDGLIRVWDLETMTCIRNLNCHLDDVLSVSLVGKELFSASADGQIVRWSPEFRKVTWWMAHEGRALSLGSVESGGRSVLLSGGSDKSVKIWDLVVEEDGDREKEVSPDQFHGRMFRTLRTLVSYASISDGEHKEECRQAALYLRRLLSELGAESVLLPVQGRNPLVLAKFKPNKGSTRPPYKRVLFYGHYDTFGVNEDQWEGDPFKLTGKNGFLYGRGVSDNKGPIIAVAHAAATLYKEKALDVEFIMLLEGEEENGSLGFKEAVKQHKSLIADKVDVVLVSNSYWLSDDIPCMTYGLRGVIHLSLSITSSNPDLHSGVHGGAIREPLLELVHLLSTITTSTGHVLVPDFYEDIRPQSEEEIKHFDDILARSSKETISKLLENTPTSLKDPREALIKRWREPSISIHKVEMTGLASTIIPGKASVSLSVRIVPDQKLDKVIGQLTKTLEDNYKDMKGEGKLSVTVEQAADWWLGSFASTSALTFANCIKEEWGGDNKVDPLWIREGGTIPCIPFLERELEADISIHFPMGMGSDKAHLTGERMRMINLEKGMKVIKSWLESGKVADK